MGPAGAYLSKNAIFISAAILCIPALIALSRIRADEIDYARARGGDRPVQPCFRHRRSDERNCGRGEHRDHRPRPSKFRHGVTFSLIAAVAASATVMSWLFLSETRPARYWD
jgi:hypothetical protein